MIVRSPTSQTSTSRPRFPWQHLGGVIPRGALLALLLLGGTACAPGLGKSFVLDPVPSPAGAESGGVTSFALAPITDARPAPWVVEISGRAVPAQGEITVAAEKYLRKALLARKILLHSGEFPLVEVALLTWTSTVDPSFPATKIESRAAIEVTTRGLGNKIIFRATYRGDVSRQTPWAGEGGIREDLYAALEQALDAWLKDGAFRQGLAR